MLKTDIAKLVDAWQRIHGVDMEPAVLADLATRISKSTLAEAGQVDVRLCPDCGRRIATGEAELREQLAQVTAQRDALVETGWYLLAVLNPDYEPHSLRIQRMKEALEQVEPPTRVEKRGMDERVEVHFPGGGWTNGLPANMDDAVEQISLLQGDLRRVATKLAQVTAQRDALVKLLESPAITP